MCVVFTKCYGLQDTRFEFPQGREIFLFSGSPDRRWGTLSLLFSGKLDYFPDVKRSERVLNHSPPANAEVMNEWSCTSTPPPHLLQGVNRNSFFFFNFYVFHVLKVIRKNKACGGGGGGGGGGVFSV
jgi:hypothetical protein